MGRSKKFALGVAIFAVGLAALLARFIAVQWPTVAMLVGAWIAVRQYRKPKTSDKLPKKRPKIIPVKYEASSGNEIGTTNGESLYLENHGIAAFDILIQPISLDDWTVSFRGPQNLTENGEYYAKIRTGNTSNTRLYDPWLTWWQAHNGDENAPAVNISITYRDLEENHYETSATLFRNSFIKSGWEIGDVKQKRL